MTGTVVTRYFADTPVSRSSPTGEAFVQRGVCPGGKLSGWHLFGRLVSLPCGAQDALQYSYTYVHLALIYYSTSVHKTSY